MTPKPMDPHRQMRLATFGPLLVRAFMRQGLDPSWGLAIARQESDITPTAHSTSPADLRRGGSWGLCQMSLQTARECMRYSGDGPGMCDPEINAALAAAFCRQLCDQHQVTTLSNVAALYNSGRTFDKAPPSTRDVYVPNVLRFQAEQAPFVASIVAKQSPGILAQKG